MSDHYFSAAPASADERRPLTLELAGHTVTVETATGVFSSDRLDPGTAVLLDHVPAPPATGTFVDVGCGWGPIALTLALRSPDATVYAVDVNERARDLTRRNAERLGCSNVVVASPEEALDRLEHGAVDLIWSNPPIRVGKEALHDLLVAWLGRLSPDGRAELVVSKNLGSDSLQTWLRGLGYGCERAASSKGFRVLSVTLPD